MILYIRQELIAIDSNLGALCRVGCKNIIRTLGAGGKVGETGNMVRIVQVVCIGHHIARRVGGYRVGWGSDKYLLDTGRGFVLAIEMVMCTLHLFRRLCLCIQITTSSLPHPHMRALCKQKS